MNYYFKNNMPCYNCGGQYTTGGEMIKRADGSYSQRGFWDNIRDNAGSGKKPTREMLAMEAKLNKGEYGGQPQNAGFQALPNYVQEKILSRMDEGGEPNGGMALGQIMAVADKMNMLSKFVNPEKNLDPWIASKLAVMDDSAAAIADYMMYNPESQEGEDEEEMDEMKSGGYTVRRSNDRKGKTHVVIGPDGTKKYFGDSNLGQHPKDPERKKAFYARHASNLKNNPYFRAYAKATWEEGGQYEDGGIHIDPSKKGTFKAQATRMGMSVQEAASHIMANKEDFSPEMVKKAVFAHNFANQFGGIVDEDFEKYERGGRIELPKAQTGLEFLIPMAINAIGSAGAAGAAGAGAGAAAGAGSGSALAGAAAKGLGSQLLGKAGNSQNTQSGGAGKFFGAAGKFYDKSSEIASNSPDITSYNLANAAMLPDEGYLSGLKAMVGLGTALSNVAGTFTQPFAGTSPFAKNAGKSNLQVPTPPIKSQKMGVPQKQTIPDYYSDTKNSVPFMPQIEENPFQEGMPLKQQVGPVAEFDYGGILPRYQGVDEFGNFTSSIVNPGLNGIKLGQSLYSQSAVGQQSNALKSTLPEIGKTIDAGYDPAKKLYESSQQNQTAQNLKEQNPFASGLNNVGDIQDKPAGLPPALGGLQGPGLNRTMGFIGGMNMFNTVLEARQNKKARTKWEKENMNNTDTTINPTVVDNPFGLYDPNTGVLKPAKKVATQDFGTTGVANYGGQKMYRQGGTYMLDKNEIMRILAAGGEIEFI